jgi:hypothetical protein
VSTPRVLALSCVVATAFGCDACSMFDEEVESHVDVPATVDELEQWASERGLTAEVGAVERESGNVACGHSPACLILVPIIAANALLPSTLKRGSVIDDAGVVLYAGVFDLRGRLLVARVRAESGDVYREIERLPLDELGQHPIVEVARVRIDGEGNELERTETSLVDQVDVVAMYAEALAEEGDADDRADLVVEELQHLGAQGLLAAEARYDGLDSIDDEELVQVLHEVCHGHAPGAEMVVRVVADKGGLRPSIKAVLCLERGRLSASHFSGIVARIVDAACEGDDVPTALPAAIDLSRQLTDAVIERAGACGDEVRRLHLQFHAGQRPSDSDLERVLREDAQAPLLVNGMSPRGADDRRVLVAVMDAASARLAVARALNRGTTGGPTAAEMGRAATVFAADHEGSDIADMRHHLLDWMSRGEPGVASAALGPLRARAAEPHNAAALIHLGRERGRLGAAVTGLDPDRVHWSSFQSPRDSFNDPTLVAYALSEAGCTRDEIRSAARAVRRGGEANPCAGW